MENDLTQSLTRRLPWAVTAAVTVGFIAAWPKPPPPPEAQRDVPAAATVDSTAPIASAPTASAPAATASAAPPLQLLDTCMQQLERHRARASAAAKTKAKVSSKEEVAKCLVLPEVVQAIEKACMDESAPPAVGPDAFARQFSSQVVGVAEDDAEWLEGYMCRVHRLRENMVEDLRGALSGDASDDVVDQLITEAQDAREAALEDVKARLGEERYARLRSVGGVGMLAASLDCTDDAP